MKERYDNVYIVHFFSFHILIYNLFPQLIYQCLYFKQAHGYYEPQAVYFQNDYNSQTESTEGSLATHLAGFGRLLWNEVLTGLRRVSDSFRRTFYEESSVEKQALNNIDGPSSSLQNIASSGAWAFPAAGIATALLFRTQIEEIFEYFLSKP